MRYNKANSEQLAARGIEINDLCSLMLQDTDRYISDDGIHPTEEGYELLARQVAEQIRKLL